MGVVRVGSGEGAIIHSLGDLEHLYRGSDASLLSDGLINQIELYMMYEHIHWWSPLLPPPKSIKGEYELAL